MKDLTKKVREGIYAVRGFLEIDYNYFPPQREVFENFWVEWIYDAMIYHYGEVEGYTKDEVVEELNRIDKQINKEELC